ncbi:MAG: AAA family ATPase, partial [Deltaproteobacteria bacterium]|nr:AAA family ATPase [Deltaproteobacteria bacterium]
MKILRIHFKNLNSLKGEWSIDLTHPMFDSGGIFLITGATGSGKSTILDAICLALYGRTPRLGKITKNANEILSR